MDTHYLILDVETGVLCNGSGAHAYGWLMPKSLHCVRSSKNGCSPLHPFGVISLKLTLKGIFCASKLSSDNEDSDQYGLCLCRGLWCDGSVNSELIIQRFSADFMSQRQVFLLCLI